VPSGAVTHQLQRLLKSPLCTQPVVDETTLASTYCGVMVVFQQPPSVVGGAPGLAALAVDDLGFLLCNSFTCGTFVLSVDGPNGERSYDAGFGLCLPWCFGISGVRRRAKTTGRSTCQDGQGESDLLRCEMDLAYPSWWADWG